MFRLTAAVVQGWLALWLLACRAAADGVPSAEPESKKAAGSKERPADGDQGDGKGSMLAFVCLNQATMPEKKALDQVVKKWFNLPGESERKVELEASETGLQSVTVSVGAHSAVAGLMPRPIPEPDIRSACARSFFWPEAWKEMKGHKAHLVIVAIGRFEQRYARSLFLSRVAAALSEAFDTAGIYWGDAHVVHSPDFFRKGVKPHINSADDVPAQLWVGFLPRKHEDGTLTCGTVGLAEFGCMELEIVRTRREPVDIIGMLGATAAYLIHSGSMIKDGDTIGPDAATKIKTRYADSALGREGKVIRIDY